MASFLELLKFAMFSSIAVYIERQVPVHVVIEKEGMYY